MRGSRKPQATMLGIRGPGGVRPIGHPLRIIKAVADGALERLSAECDQMYSKVGWASVPLERLL